MKFTKEQLIKFVHEAEKTSICFVAKKYGIDDSYLLRVAWRYKADPIGFLQHKQNNKYTLEFKLMVINDWSLGKLSLNEIMLKYKLKTTGTISSWYHVYKSKGIEGLKGMKTGRPKKSTTQSKVAKKKPIKQLIGLKRAPTYEEYKIMEQEILRLQCQEAVTKKLETLTRDYLIKKNNI